MAAGSYTRRAAEPCYPAWDRAPGREDGRAVAPGRAHPAPPPTQTCQHQRITHELHPPRARRRAPHRHREGRRRPSPRRAPPRRRLRPRPRVGRPSRSTPTSSSILRRHVGPNALIDLSIDGGKAKPVLVHGVQIHKVNRRPIHVDLFAVRMTEELTVDVPVHGTGESEAVTKHGGTLLNASGSVKVRARPDHLPQVDRGRPRRPRRLRRRDPRSRPADPGGRHPPDRPRRDRLQGLAAARPGGRGGPGVEAAPEEEAPVEGGAAGELGGLNPGGSGRARRPRIERARPNGRARRPCPSRAARPAIRPARQIASTSPIPARRPGQPVPRRPSRPGVRPTRERESGDGTDPSRVRRGRAGTPRPRDGGASWPSRSGPP